MSITPDQSSALSSSPAPVVYVPPTHAAGNPSVSPDRIAAPVPPVVAPAAPAAKQIPPRTRKCSNVWGVPFDHVTLDQSIDAVDALIQQGTPSYVITANLNYAMLNHHDPASMGPVTRDAALILADGQPIVWRSRWNQEQLPERVAGSEMIYRLAKRSAEQGWGIYFLGGEPGVAATCADQLARQYPGLRIAGIESPPFRQLTDQEQADQDARIQNSGAQILLVAFGQPKGEKWIHQNYQRLGIPVSIQLGASFDFIAGTATRAPEIWQRFGMEWAYRMMTDPKRLVPRYAANAWFLIAALVEDWRQLVIRWGMWTPQT
ncbi:Putative N-acetylmannosaminyltransferase [Rubripirellula lacrimiformis]|uniref:N-acetylmannosaminyltransferase n=1 Tax=Rubripirellula lacrimiformis TaxID=1930273 RepID=A0A517N3I1_9BACT|nr:WecB/TagA/CpsF family glycosyltransferase [Rubripirellula lacrimiformis]QDT01695.1 Putative N-acetylmannosaminyltransferase [Rubripirellula lacrimiformis]